MIYLTMFYEFFKIGLLAIGGGLVTVPFLFDLSDKYGWFSKNELANMIAVSESTPGPIGINMATFAGFNTSGLLGSLVATTALILPSLIIMIIIARLMQKYSCNTRVHDILSGIRPSVLALILYAGLQIGKISLTGNLEILFFAGIFTMMRLWKKSPIFYLSVSAIIGIILKI